MKLSIPARAINFVAPFKADIDIRHYLTGVYVRPMTAEEGGGVLVCATNGHAAGIWRQHSDDPVCERPSILLVTPGLLAACKKNADRRSVVIINDRLTVVETGPASTDCTKTEVYIQPATGWVSELLNNRHPWEIGGARMMTYPDIMRVMPDAAGSGATGKINISYLDLATKAFRSAGGVSGRKWGVGIHLRQVHHNQAMLVVSEDMPEAAAIIMPMRENTTGCSPVPTWIPKAKAASDRTNRATSAPLPVHEPSDAGPPDGDGRGWSFVKNQL